MSARTDSPTTLPRDLTGGDNQSTTRRSLVPFLAVETATVLAGTANGITMVAFPWLVLEVTGSPAAAGVIAGVTAVPTIIAALFSGTVVDLVGRRYTSMMSDVLSLLSVLAVPIAAFTGHLSLGILIAVATLGAVFDPAGMAARESMIPAAAQAARLPLERVNGIHEATWGVAFLVGPALGGVLIGLVGATTTFWATAVCFALSVIVIGVVRIPGSSRPTHVGRPRGVWTSTRQGLVFLRREPLLRSLAILYMLLVAGYMPIQSIVLPAWFESRGEPERLGILLLALSLGGVIGALGYSTIAMRVRRHRMLVLATFATTLPILALALLPPFAVMLALGFASGFAWGPINPMVNLAIQRRTPSDMLGRVNGLFQGVAVSFAPVGYLIAGVMYAAIGPQWTLAFFGGVLVVLSGLMLSRPALRGIDDLVAASH